MMLKDLTVYTDGSCYPNPGPAGMAFVCPEINMAHNAAITRASNNQAELMAIGFAFTSILEWSRETGDRKDFHVTVYSDSEYAIRELRRRTPRVGRPNYELICGVRSAARALGRVKYVHVRGHSGNPFNEHCDQGAKEARLSGMPTVKDPNGIYL